MGTFVLIMVILTGTFHDTEATTVHTQEFNSKAACEAAATQFKRQQAGHWRFRSVCVAK